MENASKALIIAGAILLSILIIGLGMFIYQKAVGLADTSTIDSAKVDAYNSKFENYKGIISGSQARTLCNTIKSHNRNTAEDETQFVTIMLSDASTTTSNGATSGQDATTFNTALDTNAVSKIRSGYSYEVSFGYEPGSGLIIAVGLTQQTN